ncbi:MAG: hypothetical protein OCD01_04015 [Fibrobacterales bacterium]
MTSTSPYTWEIYANFNSSSDPRFKISRYGNEGTVDIDTVPHNYGLSGIEGVAALHGSSIRVDSTFKYKITFNSLTKEYTIDHRPDIISSSLWYHPAGDDTDWKYEPTGFGWQTAFFHSNLNNWKHTPMTELIDDSGVWEIYVDFTQDTVEAEPRFKFNHYDHIENYYGDNNDDGEVNVNESSIRIDTLGIYHIVFKSENKQYSYQLIDAKIIE